MKKLSLILFSFVFFFFKSSVTAGEFIHGKLRIIDGDTIVIKNQKIRLFGIDAPEMKQICTNKFKKNYNCGAKSKKALEKAISEELTKTKNLSVKYKKNYNVWCKTKGKDRYKRIIGICAVNQISLFIPENSHPNKIPYKNLPGSNVKAPAIKSAPTYTPIIERI